MNDGRMKECHKWNVLDQNMYNYSILCLIECPGSKLSKFRIKIDINDTYFEPLVHMMSDEPHQFHSNSSNEFIIKTWKKDKRRPYK